MKKFVLLATTGLTIASSTYAAMPTGAAPFQIIVPNLNRALELNLEALYLQPTNSDLDYATLFNNVSNANTLNTANPSFEFGFRIGLGYVFPNSGNDVQLNWTHINPDSTDTTNFGTPSTGSNFLVSSAGISYLLPSGSTNAMTTSSNTDINYDAVDLDVGQYLSLGTRLTTRLFMGLRYAQLKNDLTNTYSGAFADDATGSENDFYHSKFTGIGPRFGIDASYNVWKCLGVVGHMSAALLVGQVEANTTLSNTSTESSTTTSSTSSITADNQTRVVPAFDAKLGLDYSVPLQNGISYMTIEAGYQVTQYVDAMDRLNGNVGSSPSDTSLQSTSRTTSSFGFNGPYLNVNFRI